VSFSDFSSKIGIALGSRFQFTSGESSFTFAPRNFYHFIDHIIPLIGKPQEVIAVVFEVLQGNIKLLLAIL